MEHFSGRTPELSNDEEATPTIEKLSGWVMGLQAEVRAGRSGAEKTTEAAKTELDFERRREIRDEPTNLHHGGMIALGEVLADKTSDRDLLLGKAGIKHVAKQKKLAKEEANVSHGQTNPPRAVVTTNQAVQTGIAVGLTIALLILIWIAVK